MLAKRNNLYKMFTVAAVAGYSWLWFNWYQPGHHLTGDIGMCLIKHVTNIPCPSCGVTRSIMALLHGNFLESIFWNPFGLIMSVFMLVLPVWITIDVLFKSSSLYNFFIKCENLLRRPSVAMPLATMVIVNWIWNISKGL